MPIPHFGCAAPNRRPDLSNPVFPLVKWDNGRCYGARGPALTTSYRMLGTERVYFPGAKLRLRGGRPGGRPRRSLPPGWPMGSEVTDGV